MYFFLPFFLSLSLSLPFHNISNYYKLLNNCIRAEKRIADSDLIINEYYIRFSDIRRLIDVLMNESIHEWNYEWARAPLEVRVTWWLFVFALNWVIGSGEKIV